MRGEIVFREKLSKQHVDGEVLLPDYFRKEEHDEIISRRMDETRSRMSSLNQQGVAISPYIEMGAERGFRSLVLENEFGAAGIAADLSFHQLRTMPHFAGMFGMSKLPLRVCCNAYNLPFRTDAVPFVFCYQYLHHFPALAPVIEEIHRVLGSGRFLLDDEPFRRPRVVLYRKRHSVYSTWEQRKPAWLRFLEDFFSEEKCDEESHGILENHDITINEWAEALSRFDDVEVSLFSGHRRFRSRLGAGFHFRNLINAALGGGVAGLCGKESDGVIVEEPEDALICPDCRTGANGQIPAEVRLIRSDDVLTCSSCSAAYPVVDGVIFLLAKTDMKELYPEYVI
ncbi:MAG: methyltransferase domain-containing protein [Verrucomicrobia bacterium]|nr:methyltransferase domain-containing protein [Verrucomicrobiota bacterium]